MTYIQSPACAIAKRNGAYAMADGRWRLPVDAKTGVDPGYTKLLLAYEDRRFYSHGGVDPLALGRAAFQLVTRGQKREARLHARGPRVHLFRWMAGSSPAMTMME